VKNPIPTLPLCRLSPTSGLCPHRHTLTSPAPLSPISENMAALSSKALLALADYDEARADYMRFLSMDTPDDKAVNAAMVAMDTAHIRFKQEMGDFDAPRHLRPV